MKKRFSIYGVILVGIVTVVAAGTAYADPLPPNAFQENPKASPNQADPDFTVYGSDADPRVVGDGGIGDPLLGHTLITTMSPSLVGDYAGFVTSSVWEDTDGTLTFVYSFDITGAVSSPVRSATIGGDWSFAGVSMVGTDTSGLSMPVGVLGWDTGEPLTIARLPLGSALGAPAITFATAFFYDNGTTIGEDEYTANFWFNTDVTIYTTDSFDLLDAGRSADAPAYVVAVPAPGAVLLGAMGLGLVGWLKRRFA